MHYILPPDYVAADLPETGEANGNHIEFRQTITRVANGFVVDEDASVTSRRIPREPLALKL